MNQPADLHPCNLDSGNPCRNDDVSSSVGLGFYWLSKKMTLIKGSLDAFKMPLAGFSGILAQMVFGGFSPQQITNLYAGKATQKNDQGNKNGIHSLPVNQHKI